MNSVDGKNDQDGEIGNQDGKVEGIGLINASKRVLVKDLGKINADSLNHRIGGRHEKGQKELMHSRPLYTRRLRPSAFLLKRIHRAADRQGQGG